MTRDDLCELINQYAIAYSKYTVELVLTDHDSFVQPKPPLNPCGLIYDSFEQQTCANCIKQLNQECDVFDSGYSTELDFGCNRFEPCK